MCGKLRRQGGVMAPSESSGDGGGHDAMEYIYKNIRTVVRKALIRLKRTEYDAILQPYQA